MKKSLKTLLVLAVCAFLAALCGVFAGCNIDYEGIYNDDAKIKSTNTYTAVGQVTTIHTRSANVSCHSFSGVDTLFKWFEVDDNTSLDLTINISGTGGKLKVVLCGSEDVFTIQ